MKWIKTSYPGVRYREHPSRKHGVRPDRYYSIRYKLDGRDKEEGCGWGSQGMTAQKAAEQLVELKQNQRAGEGPKSLLEKREAAEAVRRAEDDRKRIAAESGSLEQLFKAYVEHLKQRGRKSWKEVERSLLTAPTAAVHLLGRTTKAKAIAPRDIQKVLKKTHERGPSMAAHMRAYLHGAFNFGVGREFDYTRPALEVRFDLPMNPVASVPRDTSAFRAGDRALTWEEVKAVWAEFPDAVDERTSLAVRLILAVGGQRVEEVLRARKAEFDLKQALWTLPSDRTKNGREHLVPLTPRSIGLVRRAMALTGESELLFPMANALSKPMPSTSLNRAAGRFCKRVGMERWTPRDLRRTCRTLLADAGEPSYLLNLHFNHGQQGVGEKHYDRSSHLDEKRPLMARWDALLAKALGEETGGKVVEFPNRAANQGG